MPRPLQEKATKKSSPQSSQFPAMGLWALALTACTVWSDIGADAQSGLVHTVRGTSSHVSDIEEDYKQTWFPRLQDAN